MRRRILKSSLYLWCYNIPLLNQFWKRNWFNQYFHLPFIKCRNIPSWHQKASPFLFTPLFSLFIKQESLFDKVNFIRLTSTWFTLYVCLCTTFFVSQISTMSFSFLCLLSKKQALKRLWPLSFASSNDDEARWPQGCLSLSRLTLGPALFITTSKRVT